MTSSSQKAYLSAVIDSQHKRYLLGAAAVCRIGRGEQNTIVLHDQEASRAHAMVQAMQRGEYYLIDLGSRNGTFLNQRRITTPTRLMPGDQITIGCQEIRFYGPDVMGPDMAESTETLVNVDQQMITVLVADIRDFTGLSQRLGESRLSLTMTAFFRECGMALAEHGARGQKYIGDAVMAFWLHHCEPPDIGDMVSVFAALARLFEVAAKLQVLIGLEVPVRIGAGVNTGLACVGNIGSTAAPDYTALSDAVNLAFRLESATKDIGCDVALGGETCKLLAKHADIERLFESRTVALKGYEQSLAVYGGTCESVIKLIEVLRPNLPTSHFRAPTEKLNVKGGA